LGNVNGGITLNHAQDGRALSPAPLALDQEKDKEKDKDKDDYKVMGEEIRGKSNKPQPPRWKRQSS
jgi:hypothetical protein